MKARLILNLFCFFFILIFYLFYLHFDNSFRRNKVENIDHRFYNLDNLKTLHIIRHGEAESNVAAKEKGMQEYQSWDYFVKKKKKKKKKLNKLILNIKYKY